MISIQLHSKTDKINLWSRSKNSGYLEETCKGATEKLVWLVTSVCLIYYNPSSCIFMNYAIVRMYVNFN